MSDDLRMLNQHKYYIRILVASTRGDQTKTLGETKMMKRLLGIMLLVGALLTASAFAQYAEITSVELDDDEISPNGANIFDVDRGDELEVKVHILALNDSEDVQISASLRGFDSSDTIDDISEVFDIKEGVTYRETLKLPLRQKLDQDRYVLRIRIEDRNNPTIEETYTIEVDTQEHDVEIRDVVLSPGTEVKAGRALLATVRLRNRGEDDEEGVKVVVSIPSLGVSATDFIDEMERDGDDDDEATSEELFLRIPEDAATGDYAVRVEAIFDQGDKKNVKEMTIHIVADETADTGSAATGSVDKTVITVAADGQNAIQGGAEVAYPITLTNAGKTAKTYMVAADGASWANFRVSPSNVIVVNAGESKAVTIYVSAKKDAPVGAQTFTVTISTADRILKQVPLTVNVEQAKAASESGLKRAIEVGLVVLVILLVIIGLIIGFSKLRGDDDEDDEDVEEEKTYY